jgi:outer membrane autotransporter protein
VPTYRTEVPLLAALPAQLRQADVAMLASSHRRSGDDDAGAPAVASLEPVAGALTSDRRAWARAIHDDLDLRQPGTVAPASKGRITGLQAGTDLFASGDGRWRGGVYVGSQDGRADVSGLASGLWRRVGANDLRARYLGAYAGFENATGFYADAVLQHGTHNYTARPLDGLPVGGKGRSLTASLELGQAFRLAGSWTLEPQLQLMHRHARLDDAALPLALVRQDDGSGWQARAGVRIKGDLATAAGRLQPYARLDVHRGSGSSTAQFIGPGGSTGITSGMGHTSVGLAGGATLALGRSASLYGEIGKLFSTGSGARVASSVQGAIGLRVRW